VQGEGFLSKTIPDMVRDLGNAARLQVSRDTDNQRAREE
jgi:hypothetical protein